MERLHRLHLNSLEDVIVSSAERNEENKHELGLENNK